jgi:hypothetical protein
MALRLVTSSLFFGVKAARKRPELREIGWQRTVPFVIDLNEEHRLDLQSALSLLLHFQASAVVRIKDPGLLNHADQDASAYPILEAKDLTNA